MELTREEFDRTYEIGNDLGVGASATVKEAKKRNYDGNEYAVKFRVRESTERARKQCEREIKSVLKLKHKNIVQFFHFCPNARLGDIKEGQ